jgi:hypothetical protein
MPPEIGTPASHQANSVPKQTGREQSPSLAYIVVSGSLTNIGRGADFRRNG